MADFKNLAWATSFATRASRKFIYLPYRASGKKSYCHILVRHNYVNLWWKGQTHCLLSKHSHGKLCFPFRKIERYLSCAIIFIDDIRGKNASRVAIQFLITFLNRIKNFQIHYASEQEELSSFTKSLKHNSPFSDVLSTTHNTPFTNEMRGLLCESFPPFYVRLVLFQLIKLV